MKKISFLLKHYKTIFALSSITMVAVCCKSTQSVPAAKPAPINFAAVPWGAPAKISLVPVESDVSIARVHWPGTTRDELNEGYSIFNDKCTDCHETKNPQDFTVDEWNVLMHQMGRKAKLDSNQYKLVIHYILTKREAVLGPGK
ncbi:MAG TPA: hypothetical protein VK809_12370 [Bacteroidia bacterium]|nr:hypothetical protein [Bacteroidia bacterium]